MQFIFQYPDFHGTDGDMLDAGPVAELAVTAERSGWHGFAFTEHPAPTQKWLDTGGHQSLDPFVALAARRCRHDGAEAADLPRRAPVPEPPVAREERRRRSTSCRTAGSSSAPAPATSRPSTSPSASTSTSATTCSTRRSTCCPCTGRASRSTSRASTSTPAASSAAPDPCRTRSRSGSAATPSSPCAGSPRGRRAGCRCPARPGCSRRCAHPRSARPTTSSTG